MQLTDTIEKVHNVKNFSHRKPDWRDILECIDTARYAPMAGENFSLKFILIDNPNSIQKITDAAQQPFISQAQYLIIVCTDKKRTKTLFKDKAEIYCRQQAGAAIQNIILALTEKRLSTYWVRHFVESLIKTELKIPENIDIEAILPIGYEKGKTKKSEKIEADVINYFNNWGNKKMNPPKGIFA
ncbi:MAG: nitroreductase family protein [Candidatus Pacearchaeota archaeon]|nr:nitroreductase family protein [Candidatus Pacearchaeota archaeon]